jgi:hypothetical protein
MDGGVGGELPMRRPVPAEQDASARNRNCELQKRMLTPSP